jgi:hypothetical protein
MVVGISTKEVHTLVGYIPENSQGSFELAEVLTKDDKYFEKIKMSSNNIMDFRGFTDTFLKL